MNAGQVWKGQVAVSFSVPSGTALLASASHLPDQRTEWCLRDGLGSRRDARPMEPTGTPVASCAGFLGDVALERDLKGRAGFPPAWREREPVALSARRLRSWRTQVPLPNAEREFPFHSPPQEVQGHCHLLEVLKLGGSRDLDASKGF